MRVKVPLKVTKIERGPKIFLTRAMITTDLPESEEEEEDDVTE